MAPPLPTAERRAFVAARAAVRGWPSARSSPKVMHYADSPASSSSSARRAAPRAGRAGHDLPRPLPAHEGHAAVRAVHAGRGDRRRLLARLRRARRAPTAGLHRLLRALQAPELAGDARSDPGDAAGPRHRPARVPEGQADGARRRRSSTSTRSTSCAGPRASTNTSDPEQEAFDIEYWPLEEAKLQRLPPPKALEGPGRARHRRRRRHRPAAARRLLAEGAHVVLLDIDRGALDDRPCRARRRSAADRVRGAHAT